MAFEQVAQKSRQGCHGEYLMQGMNNIMPTLEVKARRIGGATYQVPIEVRPERQALALRWMTTFCSYKGEKTMVDKLATDYRCKPIQVHQ